MPAECFFDTNILLYAYDNEAGRKRLKASALVSAALKDPGRFAISVQVLQEFFVNFTRRGQSDEAAATLVDDFSAWNIVANTHELFLAGLEARARWQLSLWDAMIIAAATRAGTPILYSEDLNHQQHYGSVQVINPFLDPTAA
ncbi:MAG: PIN domain-containing protein [Chthoniobacterales bacterium]|nr:PIN domain-containing protein [Chthoniobacterales bacterium]